MTHFLLGSPEDVVSRGPRREPGGDGAQEVPVAKRLRHRIGQRSSRELRHHHGHPGCGSLPRLRVQQGI